MLGLARFNEPGSVCFVGYVALLYPLPYAVTPLPYVVTRLSRRVGSAIKHTLDNRFQVNRQSIGSYSNAHIAVGNMHRFEIYANLLTDQYAYSIGYYPERAIQPTVDTLGFVESHPT